MQPAVVALSLRKPEDSLALQAVGCSMGDLPVSHQGVESTNKTFEAS